MNERAWVIVFALLCHAADAYAGHGFLNSFGDVQSLPDPGRTPDQFAYRFDLWEEQAQLAMLGSPIERFHRSLEFAREKLAEIELMVKRNDPNIAHDSLDAYKQYLQAATGAISKATAEQANALAERLAHSLLEHQYILAFGYLELPIKSRSIVLDAMSVAAKQYDTLTQILSPAFKASLFFKEEEVRWSSELARQADVQGQ